MKGAAVTSSASGRCTTPAVVVDVVDPAFVASQRDDLAVAAGRNEPPLPE
jgi:hypothetical protein